MPLASTAMEIKRMYEEVKKPFEETLEAWREFERKEMEAFEGMSPPEGKGFAPSDDLRKSLKAWSGARYRANVIEKWTYLFTETYVALLSGKITLSEAEGRLKRVNSIHLAVRDHFAEAKIFNSWAANWKPGIGESGCSSCAKSKEGSLKNKGEKAGVNRQIAPQFPAKPPLTFSFRFE